MAFNIFFSPLNLLFIYYSIKVKIIWNFLRQQLWLFGIVVPIYLPINIHTFCLPDKFRLSLTTFDFWGFPNDDFSHSPIFRNFLTEEQFIFKNIPDFRK
jgi:hypothetical protein